MKIYFIFALLFSFCSLYAENQTATNSEIIEAKQIENLFAAGFSNYTTMKASFKEALPTSLRGGQLSFKKPDKLKIIYGRPGEAAEMEIFIFSNTAYINIPKLKVVCQQQLGRSSGEKSKINYLNLQKLFTTYNFNFHKSRQLQPVLTTEDEKKFRIRIDSIPLSYVFVLTPKDVTVGHPTLIIYISPDGIIRRAIATSIENRTIDTVYFNIVLNQTINNEDFVFDPPVDSQVIKNVFFDLNLNNGNYNETIIN